MEMDSDESGFEEVSMEREERRRGEELVRREGRGRQLTPLSQFPDMLFGWRPKQPRSGPIPLFFDKCELPISLNPLTSQPNPIIYLGFRPKDTYELHQLLSAAGDYTAPSYPAIQVCALLQRYESEGKPQREFVGMSPDANASDLVFDSAFESGNLDMAVRVREQEYDLYMRTDANTKGHNQWYFFSVVAPKAQSVRFHILNFTKSASLYSQGMQPMVLQPASSWKPLGYNLIYRPSKLNSLINRTYYSLSFTYSFTIPTEKVYFAYAIPYQYTHLNRLLAEILPSPIIKQDVLCRSLGGVEVPLLVVTDCAVPVEEKASVVVTARVHPGETMGSWMMEGLLRLLVSEDEVAKGLRKRLIFYIVPMLNPDGVLLGNYRTGLSGNDLNRQFQSPSSLLHPTIHSLKSLLTRLKRSHRLLAFLDLHAHSQQKSVFLYGPHYPLHSVRYMKARILPRLICAQSPLYRYPACRFRNERSKRKAARLVIWKELKLTNSYTIEASFYGYIAADRSTVPFTQQHVMEAGEAIAKGLFAYVQLEEARNHSQKPTNRHLNHSRKAKTQIKIPTEDPIPDSNCETSQASQSSDEDCSADDLDPADSNQLQHDITAVVTQFRRTPAQRWKSNRKLRQFDRNSELKERCESSVIQVERSRIELNSNRTVIPKIYNPAIPLRSQRPMYKERLFRHVTCDDLKTRMQHKSPDSASFHLPVDITGRMNAWLCVQPSHRLSKEPESDSDSDSRPTKQPRCPVPPLRAFKGEVRRPRPAAMLRERSELLADASRL